MEESKNKFVERPEYHVFFDGMYPHGGGKVLPPTYFYEAIGIVKRPVTFNDLKRDYEVRSVSFFFHEVYRMNDYYTELHREVKRLQAKFKDNTAVASNTKNLVFNEVVFPSFYPVG